MTQPLTERLREGESLEQWKPVLGFEDRYMVSDFGRVYSIPRKRARGGLRKLLSRNGYLVVVLKKDGVKKVVLISRMVLEAFVGPSPKPKMEAAHWNGNRADNRIANLRWATPLENAADKVRHGTDPRTIKRQKFKLSNADVLFILRSHKQINQRDLAKRFGVHRATIQRIHSGKHYSLAKLEAGQ